MKFIHAVIYDVSEYEELKEYDIGTDNWDDLTNGDYIVHCLYSVDEEKILIHEDNCHAPVETMIDNFLDGVSFCGHYPLVEKAFIVVDNGLCYDTEAVSLCLIEGKYVEVE